MAEHGAAVPVAGGPSAIKICGQEPQAALRIAGCTTTTLFLIFVIWSRISIFFFSNIEYFVIDVFAVIFAFLLCVSECRFLSVVRSMTNFAVKWVYFVATYLGRSFFYFTLGLMYFDYTDLEGTGIGRFAFSVVFLVLGACNLLIYCMFSKYLAKDDPPPDIVPLSFTGVRSEHVHSRPVGTTAEDEDFRRKLELASSAVKFAQENPEAAKTALKLGKKVGTQDNIRRAAGAAAMLSK